jgi:hypothetical protein
MAEKIIVVVFSKKTNTGSSFESIHAWHKLRRATASQLAGTFVPLLRLTQLTHFIPFASVLCTSGGNIQELLGENFERHGGTVLC